MWLEARLGLVRANAPLNLFIFSKRNPTKKGNMFPLTPISSSTFIIFKVILFIFDFFHGYDLFLKILRENQRKESRKENKI